jgi:hypothetical protein
VKTGGKGKENMGRLVGEGGKLSFFRTCVILFLCKEEKQEPGQTTL